MLVPTIYDALGEINTLSEDARWNHAKNKEHRQDACTTHDGKAAETHNTQHTQHSYTQHSYRSTMSNNVVQVLELSTGIELAPPFGASALKEIKSRT